MVFERFRKYNLKMNPLMCTFRVSSSKFLDFVVKYKGIEVDHAKIRAIIEMPLPKNFKQLRSFQGPWPTSDASSPTSITSVNLSAS